MTADDIAADYGDVARLQVIRDAVFLAHHGQIVGRERLHLETIIAQVVGIRLAAAALRVLVKGQVPPSWCGFSAQRGDTGRYADQGDDTGPADQHRYERPAARFVIRHIDYRPDRKSTRLNSSHLVISYAVFCLKKKKKNNYHINLNKQKTKTTQYN